MKGFVRVWNISEVVGVQCAAKSHCATGNEKLECVFLETIFFEVANDSWTIEFWLNLEESSKDVPLSRNSRISKCIVCSVFVYHQKDEKHEENGYLKFEILQFL